MLSALGDPLSAFWNLCGRLPSLEGLLPTVTSFLWTLTALPDILQAFTSLCGILTSVTGPLQAFKRLCGMLSTLAERLRPFTRLSKMPTAFVLPAFKELLREADNL